VKNPALGGGNSKLLEGFLLKTCSFEGREVLFQKEILEKTENPTSTTTLKGP